MRQGLNNRRPPAPPARSTPPPTLPLSITVHLPYDRVAEEVVIGCAVDTAAGARLAVRRLDPSDFYRPAFAAVIEMLTTLDHLGDSADRIAAVAERCELPALVLSRSVAERPCLLDSRGGYANRVLHAARRRRMVLAALTLAEAAATAHTAAELQHALDQLMAAWSSAVTALAA